MGKTLPKNWVETEIGIVGDVVTGNTPSKKHSEYYEGEIPWVKPGDIRTGVELFDSVERLTTEGAKNARMLPKGAVMVTCIGNLGNIAIAGKEMATNQQINSVVFSKYVDDKFGYYACNLLKPWLIKNSTSTTISLVNKSVFQKAPFPLPPLAEQQRIVAKLDILFTHLESLKTRLDHIPQLLKNFRQAVLTQAVTGKLTEEWRVGKELDAEYFKEIELIHSEKEKPVKVRGKKGFNEELRLYEIPKQWSWIPNFKLTVDGGNAICAGPFGTIFKAKDFRDEGVPIIFLRHVKKEGFNQNKPKYMEPSVWKAHHQEYSIYGGELLITKLGDPPGEATIFPKNFGTAMVTPDVMKANYNDDVFLTKYASYFFNSKVCKDLVAEISFGMTRLRIDLTMFKSFPIAVPPKQEQTEIVKRVEALFAKADAIESQYQSLKTKIDRLPQAILQKAFKGELVEQLDTDGSAEELLEEIQRLKASLKPVKKTRTKKK
jgi:type I restriction enzyme S subunit